VNSVLETCKVNDVIGVTYGDTPTERVCRVLDVRDTVIFPLHPKSERLRPNVQRGRFLVTCQSTNGQIRSFYSGAEHNARKIPRLRAAILYLRGKLPARKRVTA